MDLNLIIPAEAAEAIRTSKMTLKNLVNVFLDQISEIKERVDAWAFLNADHALLQAHGAVDDPGIQA